MRTTEAEEPLITLDEDNISADHPERTAFLSTPIGESDDLAPTEFVRANMPKDKPVC